MAHCGGCAACDAREMAGNGGNGAKRRVSRRGTRAARRGVARAGLFEEIRDRHNGPSPGLLGPRAGLPIVDWPRYGKACRPPGWLTLWCRCELPAMNVDATLCYR